MRVHPPRPSDLVLCMSISGCIHIGSDNGLVPGDSARLFGQLRWTRGWNVGL